MFLHLGGNTVIPINKVIAILDMENTTVSSDTREFLKKSENRGFIENVSDDMPKTYIITKEKEDFKVYISSLSTTTLYKRNLIGGGF